ncbi:hypothetical protein K3725_14205 [Leisingera sp. S132]|uniref:hypothetical protein n=1 Tax=Leisingera sp. S132 TaxID=2867016 RepID=UPI0021A5B6CD|nr:hypothetical protein [Leisingera sp. S132]UWQ81342.1 hypothetical protein K3725_14205 [Leisingera sp. S132]
MTRFASNAGKGLGASCPAAVRGKAHRAADKIAFRTDIALPAVGFYRPRLGKAAGEYQLFRPGIWRNRHICPQLARKYHGSPAGNDFLTPQKQQVTGDIVEKLKLGSVLRLSAQILPRCTGYMYSSKPDRNQSW